MVGGGAFALSFVFAGEHGADADLAFRAGAAGVCFCLRTVADMIVTGAGDGPRLFSLAGAGGRRVGCLLSILLTYACAALAS